MIGFGSFLLTRHVLVAAPSVLLLLFVLSSIEASFLFLVLGSFNHVLDTINVPCSSKLKIPHLSPKEKKPRS